MSRRWIVFRGISGLWWATPPSGLAGRAECFPSQPEAIAYAYTNAAQDAELDALVADLAAWDEANVNDALRRRP